MKSFQGSLSLLRERDFFSGQWGRETTNTHCHPEIHGGNGGAIVDLTDLPLVIFLLGNQAHEIIPSHTCVDTLCSTRGELWQVGKHALQIF